MTRRRPPSPARLTLTLVGVLLGAACRTGPAEAPERGSIDRARFVAAYVDLRTAAVREGKPVMEPERRREILEAHDVTEDELLAFVEEHGEDVSFMQGVWDEVETKLDSLRLTESGPDIAR